jgi:hypothetical protein
LDLEDSMILVAILAALSDTSTLDALHPAKDSDPR